MNIKRLYLKQEHPGFLHVGMASFCFATLQKVGCFLERIWMFFTCFKNSNRRPKSQKTSHSLGHMNYFILFSVILIEGFITMSVQMLTLRQLLPFTGNSIIIISIIIAIFLLFLAFGYQRGGKEIQASQCCSILIKNFTLSAVLLGFGLSYLLISTVFFWLPRYSTLVVTLIIYLLCITAPLVYLLGQTVPLTTHFFLKVNHVGGISGKVLHLSTLGSFIGSVLTTLFLMNYLSVAWTVFINYCLLTLLVFLLSNKSIKHLKELPRVGFLVFLTVPIYGVTVMDEKMNFVLTNSYANYSIAYFNYRSKFNPGNDDKMKVLMVNGSQMSSLYSNNKGVEYIETIKKILFDDLNMHNKNILVLGAAGFALSAEKTQGNHFVYVDIDPSIKKTTQTYFSPKINGNFIAEDARSYLKNTQQKYDVILSDCYNNRENIPSYLLTRDYMLHIRKSLTPSGIALFNIITAPLMTGRYAKRVDNTIRSVFSRCVAMPTYWYSNSLDNIIYVCTQGSGSSG